MDTTIEIKIRWADKDTGKSKQTGSKYKFNGSFQEAEKVVKNLESEIATQNQKFQLPLER